MIKVAVIVPTLNNKEGGYDALQSIQAAYDIWWQPIIIDNWRYRRPIAESWNLGFDIAKMQKVDYVLVINDDVLFSPWTLTGLVRTFEKRSVANLGMVTGVNLRGTLPYPENIFQIEIPSYNTIETPENPDFSCFMMDLATYDKVGTFDENFSPAYFEDNDYHYRMKLLDMKAVCSSWAPYYHIGSITQNKDKDNPVCSPEQYRLNEAYYKKKWGCPPHFEVFTKPYNELSTHPSKWKLMNKNELD